MGNTWILITGILGILLQLAGSILLFNKLNIDISRLRHREPNAENYTGFDAYKNSLKQVEDAIKHNNEENRLSFKTGRYWMLAIILGAIFQGLSLAISITTP